MALYVIRARESGHFMDRGQMFAPALSTATRTWTSTDKARAAANAMPFACDVLELRPVYRDEAAR